ncbi:hypothetical protein, partial [Escherichia coli]|uniref:hypothetical protein n=1 Tax=Escherichia coli TaxID=562 RepID=UPI00307A6FA3
YNDFDAIKKRYSDSLVTLSLIRGADTVQVKALINNKGSIGFFCSKSLFHPGNRYHRIYPAAVCSDRI